MHFILHRNHLHLHRMTAANMESLPNELIIMISDFLREDADINALVKVNSRFYHLLDRSLYRHNSKYDRSRALEWAIEHDKIATARKSIEVGFLAPRLQYRHADVWDYYPCLETLLELAVEYKRKEIVELLLAQDVDFTMLGASDYYDPYMVGTNVLCHAVENDDPALFHTLLDRVCDILLERDTVLGKRRWGRFVAQLVECLVETHQITLLEALLDRGFSLSELELVTERALYSGAKDKAIFDFLLGRGLNVRMGRHETFCLLRVGMSYGNTAAIDYFLDQCKGYYPMSKRPLTFDDVGDEFTQGLQWHQWYSCHEDKMQITVEHLINRGTDPNPKTSLWAFDTIADIRYYRHETVMQTMIKGCYARGVATAELIEGIRSWPHFGQSDDNELVEWWLEYPFEWWEKYL